jgi:integrase
VPLLPQVLQALKEVPRRLNEPRVFWWMRDRYTTLRRFKRRLEWAELPTTFHFHHLRHCFGSYAAQAGVHLEVIAQAMGHSSTSVTRLYAHLSPDYRRKELLKMAKLTVGTRRAQRSRKAAKN